MPYDWCMKQGELLPEIENGRLAGMPPAFKSRDGLYKERGELIEQMNGISPKLCAVQH